MTAEARLRAILARIARVEPEAIGPDADVRSELGLDSLTLLRVAAAIEREFDITIPDERLRDLTSLGAMVTFVSEYAARRA